jgi:hypothetical protein
MVEKPNLPLLLHSESLILEEYNSSKEMQYQKMAEAHLQQLQLVSSQFDQSVARDKPKEYALSKLIAATKNKTIAYDDEVTMLSSNLGYLQNTVISNSIPWLTYVNSLILIVVLFRIFPCAGLLTVTTPNIPPVSADPVVYSGLLTSTTLFLDFILVTCAILALLLYFWKICCKSRLKRFNQTAFKITLFAGEDEISFDLGQSAFKLTTDAELHSNTPGDLPQIVAAMTLVVDWRGYALRNTKITFNLPTSASVKPWQLLILKKILPNLRVLQITAFSGPQEPLSWSIFYPPPADH